MPLALHIPHVVEQVGSLAGFAAVIGLAVLSALYFSQARDLRRLREWAGRAPERAAEGGPAVASPIPGRVVATPQKPSPAPGAAPQPPAANGDAAPSVTAAPGAPVPAGVAKPPEGEAAEDESKAESEDAKPAEGADAKGDGEGAESDDGEAKPGAPAPLRPPG